MKILIGIAVHGAWDSARKAIESAIDACEHTYFDWDLIVTDDNSPQYTPWLEGYVAGLNKCNKKGYAVLLRNFSNPNLGQILNANLDCVEPSHDYYLNLESDVYLQPDTVQSLITALMESGAPCATPIQIDPNGRIDLHFYAKGKVDQGSKTADFWMTQNHRPKWCNLGCLLVRGDVARDKSCRVEEERFKLWCVDQDYTCSVAQKYGRPILTPNAWVTHVGQQSTREHDQGGYGYMVAEAVQYIDSKWATYLAGGLF